MASMIFASSPLSVQSFVKLRTNSNYSHSPCYVSRAKNSYIHLPNKNISNIQSSKSLFTKGDGNFSFSSPKFPRVASKYSPSLNIIKASADFENIYHYFAYDVETKTDIQLGDRYRGKILLIVNLPQKISPENARVEMKFLNDLRNRYIHKPSVYKKDTSLEVLGFFPYMEKPTRWHPRTEEIHGEGEIRKLANDIQFFRKGHDKNDRDFWNFLRKVKENKNRTEQEKEFEKYLVDGEGKCRRNFPWFEGEELKDLKPRGPESGGDPGDIATLGFGEDPRYPIENAIAGYYFKRRDNTN